ncbi:mucin-19-like [Gigantopelta aegis]|uniref:mucin-19-like n=1 Tax=Gigantopelta aegis TaxID=1735272 RepID=UPI001B889988|nr:mucin-19-like [Gigantopelta aegis]
MKIIFILSSLLVCLVRINCIIVDDAESEPPRNDSTLGMVQTIWGQRSADEDGETSDDNEDIPVTNLMTSGNNNSPQSNVVPPISTVESSSTPSSSTEPSSTTAQPTSTSAEPPSTSAEPPSTSTEPPSTSAEPSSTSAEPPSTSSEPPSTSAEPPSTSAEPPSTSAEPSSTSAAPASTSAEPSSTSAEPPSTSAEPPSTSAEPSSTSAEPPSTSAEPSSTSAAPASTSAEPPSTSAEPPNTSVEPPSSSAEPSTTTTAEPLKLKTEKPQNVQDTASVPSKHDPTLGHIKTVWGQRRDDNETENASGNSSGLPSNASQTSIDNIGGNDVTTINSTDNNGVLGNSSNNSGGNGVTAINSTDSVPSNSSEKSDGKNITSGSTSTSTGEPVGPIGGPIGKWLTTFPDNCIGSRNCMIEKIIAAVRKLKERSGNSQSGNTIGQFLSSFRGTKGLKRLLRGKGKLDLGRILRLVIVRGEMGQSAVGGQPSGTGNPNSKPASKVKPQSESVEEKESEENESGEVDENTGGMGNGPAWGRRGMAAGIGNFMGRGQNNRRKGGSRKMKDKKGSSFSGRLRSIFANFGSRISSLRRSGGLFSGLFRRQNQNRKQSSNVFRMRGNDNAISGPNRFAVRNPNKSQRKRMFSGLFRNFFNRRGSGEVDD